MSETRTVPVRRWALQVPCSHVVPEDEARAHGVVAWRESVPEGYMPLGDPDVTVHRGPWVGGERIPPFGWDPETGKPIGHPDDFLVHVEGSVWPA